MMWWTGLAPWGFEFPVPGSRISTFLVIPTPNDRIPQAMNLTLGTIREDYLDNSIYSTLGAEGVAEARQLAQVGH